MNLDVVIEAIKLGNVSNIKKSIQNPNNKFLYSIDYEPNEQFKKLLGESIKNLNVLQFALLCWDKNESENQENEVEIFKYLLTVIQLIKGF